MVVLHLVRHLVLLVAVWQRVAAIRKVHMEVQEEKAIKISPNKHTGMAPMVILGIHPPPHPLAPAKTVLLSSHILVKAVNV